MSDIMNYDEAQEELEEAQSQSTERISWAFHPLVAMFGIAVKALLQIARNTDPR